MRIFLVSYFLVPPQDVVPYAQHVMRLMGAAALLALKFAKRLCLNDQSGCFLV